MGGVYRQAIQIVEQEVAQIRHVTCAACELADQDVAALQKIGWHAAPRGSAEFLVKCNQCGQSIVAGRLEEASFCVECGRMVPQDEPKTVTEGQGVLCAGCARRLGIGMARPISSITG